jgi:hypothetical protein
MLLKVGVTLNLVPGKYILKKVQVVLVMVQKVHHNLEVVELCLVLKLDHTSIV